MKITYRSLVKNWEFKKKNKTYKISIYYVDNKIVNADLNITYSNGRTLTSIKDTIKESKNLTRYRKPEDVCAFYEVKHNGYIYTVYDFSQDDIKVYHGESVISEYVTLYEDIKNFIKKSKRKYKLKSIK